MDKELETRRMKRENAVAVCQRLNVNPWRVAYSLDVERGKCWIEFEKPFNYLLFKGQKKVDISIPVDVNKLSEIKEKIQRDYPNADKGEVQRREAIYFLQQYASKEKDLQKASICKWTIADLEFDNVAFKLMNKS